MKMLAETDYESMVMAKGTHFLAGLRDLQQRHVEIGDVDGLGLALRAEICEADGFTPSKRLVDRMVEIGLAGELAASRQADRARSRRRRLLQERHHASRRRCTSAPRRSTSASRSFDQLIGRAKRDLGIAA